MVPVFFFILLCQYERHDDIDEREKNVYRRIRMLLLFNFSFLSEKFLSKEKERKIKNVCGFFSLLVLFYFFISSSSFRFMEVMSGEDTSFVIDEVSNIIKETIERIIGGNSYQHNKVNRWTADIVDNVLTELTKLGKPFKYIVQAVCYLLDYCCSFQT